jgi:hypothetical protein
VCKIELFSRPRHQVLSADSLPWRERITISPFKLQMLYRCVRPYHDGRAGNHEVQGESWQIDLSPKSLSSAKKPRILNMVHADRKSAEARPVTENPRLQIERWVNEGGAGGEDTTPHASQSIELDRKL